MEGPCARALMDFDELKEELRQAYRDGDYIRAALMLRANKRTIG